MPAAQVYFTTILACVFIINNKYEFAKQDLITVKRPLMKTFVKKVSLSVELSHF